MSVLSKPQGQVFISYSHNDKAYLDRVHTHLEPYERAKQIDYWDDTKLVPGVDWRKEIGNAVTAAKVAILLVSADFLASQFITKYELPVLLNGAARNGTKILVVLLSPCAMRETQLARYQAVHDISRPISSLKRHEREEIWATLARDVAEAVSTQSPLYPTRLPYPSIFAIASPSGGVGKTTSTMNIGHCLADSGCKTLLIDMDHEQILTRVFTAGGRNPSLSLSDLLLGGNAPLHAALQVEVRPHLSLLPGGERLRLMEDRSQTSQVFEGKLRTLLEGSLAGFDFVLIDCPPSIGFLTRISLIAADGVIIPIHCRASALSNLSLMCETIKSLGVEHKVPLRLFGILLNAYESEDPISSGVAQQIRQHYPNDLLTSIISDLSSEFGLSHPYERTLLDFNPYSEGAQAYKRLTHEIIAKAYHWRQVAGGIGSI